MIEMIAIVKHHASTLPTYPVDAAVYIWRMITFAQLGFSCALVAYIGVLSWAMGRLKNRNPRARPAILVYISYLCMVFYSGHALFIRITHKVPLSPTLILLSFGGTVGAIGLMSMLRYVHDEYQTWKRDNP